MIDKRAQWLADVPILCQVRNFAETRTPEYFEYQVYDPNLTTVVNHFDIDAEFARRWLFPRFDTEDFPLSDDNITAFEEYFNIGEADKKQFEYDMEGKLKIVKEAYKSEPVVWPSRWKKIKGTYILLNGEKYIVAMPPEFDAEKNVWNHILTERFPKIILFDDDEVEKRKKEYLKLQTPEGVDEKVREFLKDVDVTQEDKQIYKAETKFEG